MTGDVNHIQPVPCPTGEDKKGTKERKKKDPKAKKKGKEEPCPTCLPEDTFEHLVPEEKPVVTYDRKGHVHYN